MKGADRQRRCLMAADRLMDYAAPHSNLEEASRGSRRLCVRPAANVDDSKRSTVRPPRHPCPEWSEIRPSGNLGFRVALLRRPLHRVAEKQWLVIWGAADGATCDENAVAGRTSSSHLECAE